MRKTPHVIALIIMAALLSTSCGSRRHAQKPALPASNVEAKFAGIDGCFILYDLKTSEMVDMYNHKRCKQRLPACSTFKVPLAVMAFDTGVLKDETSGFKWDGHKYDIEEWNHDQDAKSWLANSVVWFSQELTPRIGRARVSKYLQGFKYGNQDFSGGLTDAWLTIGPTGKRPKTSVMINGLEQVDFLRDLWLERLPASKRSMELTKSILPTESSPRGFTLAGKTGSGLIGRHHDQRLGWYVAHLEGHGQEFVAVVTFTDSSPSKGWAGQQAKQLMTSILSEKGLW